MALVWQLAWRYLRGKRTVNAVPALSRISMVAIGVSSGAMIIILSVFNGLETQVKEMYKAFYPDLRVSVIRGKFFDVDTARIKAIKQLGGVQAVATVIEDNVFAVNHAQQKIITLKGIDNDYFNTNDVRQYIIEGDSTVATNAAHSTAIGGRNILNELGADVNMLSQLVVNYPDPGVTNPMADPASAISTLALHPAGVFRVSDEFDSRYVLAPLQKVQELFHQPGRCSFIEIKVAPGAVDNVQKQLSRMLGSAYRVDTRFEQNRTIFTVMSGERWAIYAIMLLVILIASFNMVGALAMLVLKKQKDIAILRAMGAQQGSIRAIFLLEGVLWSLTGGLSGIMLGAAICLLQQKFGLIKLAGSSFSIDAYPVEIQGMDIVLVISIIVMIGLLISWYPAIRATKAVDPSLKST